MRQIAFLIVVFLLSIGTIGLVTPVHGIPVQGYYESPIGVINISATIPDSPSSVTAYRVVPGPNDMVYFSVDDLEKVRSSVPSESDAPRVARDILQNYGGLPEDAVLTESTVEYLIQMNGTTNTEMARYPVSTNVQYGRKINGDIPVVGDGAYINMELGDNGTLLYLNKVWRTITPDGSLAIQPVSVAIDKLRTGNVLNPKKDAHDVNVTKIRLGYFERELNQPEEYLEPAWLFRGTTETGDPIQYYVYARQFANFTTSTTSGNIPLNVTFNDTSIASPIKWLWDFGDGTNSTEQNPVHTYTNEGSYNISLQAWNDLGSDTIVKNNYIFAGITSSPVANFTATPISGCEPLDVKFSDTSLNIPTAWHWEFGDGTNSTTQNPEHIYTQPGNFTVELFVRNRLGTDNLTKNSYISVLPPNPPISDFIASPTTGVLPLTVQFSDTSRNGPTSWNWNFGDFSNLNYSAPWTPVTMHAEWTARQRFTSVVEPDGSIVLMGGSDGSGFKNDVWRSMDKGATWTLMTANAPWAARSYPTSLSMPDGSIVLMGGSYGGGFSPTVYMNDVWRSTDNGTTWILMTANAGWSPRNEQSGVVMPDGSIVLMGGYDGSYKNDVWRSTDLGATWTEVNANAGWSARFGHASVSMPDGSIVLMGGYSNGAMNDVWRSTDYGTTWIQETPHAGWTIRYAHSGVTMPDGSIVLTGGYYYVGLYNNNDVWRSTDYGATWTEVNASAGWSARVYHSSVIMPDGSIVLMGGYGSNGFNNDVWRFKPAGSMDQNPAHTYIKAGTYAVSLTSTNAYGSNTSPVSHIITVFSRDPPNASFTALPRSGKTPLIVLFNDTSLNNPTAWNWEFGDGTNSSEQNPVHTYLSPGNYTVSLHAANPYGSNVSIKTNCITVSQGTLAGTLVLYPESDMTLVNYIPPGNSTLNELFGGEAFLLYDDEEWDDARLNTGTDTGIGNFFSLYRSAWTFNTSSIPPGASITRSNLSLFLDMKYEDMGASEYQITDFSPNNSRSYAEGDWQHFGNQIYATFPGSNWNEGEQLNLTLAPSAIRKGGDTVLSGRLKWDVNRTFTGDWGAGMTTMYRVNSTRAGANRPVLYVSYS